MMVEKPLGVNCVECSLLWRWGFGLEEMSCLEKSLYSGSAMSVCLCCVCGVGVCTDDVDETSAPLMILEYMPFGDLLTFLQSYKYCMHTIPPHLVCSIIYTVHNKGVHKVQYIST